MRAWPVITRYHCWVSHPPLDPIQPIFVSKNTTPTITPKTTTIFWSVDSNTLHPSKSINIWDPRPTQKQISSINNSRFNRFEYSFMLFIVASNAAKYHLFTLQHNCASASTKNTSGSAHATGIAGHLEQHGTDHSLSHPSICQPTVSPARIGTSFCPPMS